MSLKVYSCPHRCNRGATFARYVISANKRPLRRLSLTGSLWACLRLLCIRLMSLRFLRDGENTVSPVLLSGNGNLLGAHRKPYGESNAVGPLTFSDDFY